LVEAVKFTALAEKAAGRATRVAVTWK